MDGIKRARKAKGMSLTETANKSGVHRMAIAKAERKGTDVKASTLIALARALDVPVCELFEETGHARKRSKRTKKH